MIITARLAVVDWARINALHQMLKAAVTGAEATALADRRSKPGRT
ncbi:hypothetical protein ACFOW4_03890 [Micromonospora sp. GCM10011542]